MDFQNRAGNKAGGGGNLSYAERNVDRRERMRLLAMEVSDITKDPYIMRNSIGCYECKLCLTTHNNEGNYLAHTLGKKHQSNLLRRQTKYNGPVPLNTTLQSKSTIKIGKPGYKITKLRDSDSKMVVVFEIEYHEMSKGFTPKHRIVSTYEQKVEPKDDSFQYIVFAAEPYENIGFKIPNEDLDMSDDKHRVIWDSVKLVYSVMLTYK